ncbi:MAG: UDP-N-acetylmuramoylalanine--D-glutamate ligase [Nocardioidaceae bacterium]|nr:UDP-N-acetylmuramoylalanine--D-glutamate ligase [Nocardioidaceae bacterium]
MTPLRADELESADRDFDWTRVHALVAGLGVSGFAAADALQHLGARVTAVDDRADESSTDKATLLEILGVDVRLGPGSSDAVPPGVDLVVTSPGWPPTTALFGAAAERGIPVWGEVELAWRLRAPAGGSPAPWLCVTGTNGKTTTVQMLEAMLLADGRNAVAGGNVGRPMCEIVMNPDPYDVVAVELSSHQLHWMHSLSAQAAAVLNVAPDHLSWHGDLESYRAAKARIYAQCQLACVYNADDEVTLHMVEDADVVEGCRAIGFTLGIPKVGMLGLVDDVLADRAFIEGRDRNAVEIAAVGDVPTGAPHNVANALGAAALARAHGTSIPAIRRALRSFTLDKHRIATVAQIDGVAYVDDSKATNPHAALASLSAFDSSVWIAGGLAKGASFDELVTHVRPRLRAAVLIGADRDAIAAALARHAPDVPVIVLPDADTGVMERAVVAAASIAVRGDTVLLAPACASQDLFADYSARGDAFAAAVGQLREH